MHHVFHALRNGLVVSCQAEGDDPFNSPEGVSLFARAAIMGGAVAIRTEGKAKTAEIKKHVSVPVIGLIKSYFDDGFVRITGSKQDVLDLIEVKCDIIAIDGTFRVRESLTGPDFIRSIKREFSCLIMADIATIDEGMACIEAGVDCLSTTLSGYTPETQSRISDHKPDYKLLEELVKRSPIPVFAEGRINTPDDAKRMMNLGAWGVVVGTVITRPRVVTSWFVDAVNQKH